jgi:hypothetical protein
MRIPFEIKTDSDIDEAAGFLYLEGTGWDSKPGIDSR